MESDKLILGITHGDFNGIGYEVILKALNDSRILELFVPVIYGSSKLFGYYKKQLELETLNVNKISTADQAAEKCINLIDCISEDAVADTGKSTPEAGRAAWVALEKATEDLRQGVIHGLVTAPINKNNMQSEHFHFPGHTEYLEAKFGEAASSLMLLVSDSLRVAVVTGHIPLREVAPAITEELILRKLTTLNQTLKRDFTIVRPRIAVLGLNPHAGDGGVIGNEEQTVLIPAIKQAEKQGIACFGPYPADGFFGSDSFNRFDAVLAMYHDQGLIPFKNRAMENGVNFTAGLPIVRTSPDHGTAYDIAGQNQASELSFLQAIYLACDVIRNRAQNDAIAANPLPFTEQKSRRRNTIE